MKQPRWFFALPVALALTAVGSSAVASSIRDQAGMFSAGAVSVATSQLERFEKATKVPVIIETVEDLSLGVQASKAEKHEAIEKLAIARDRESGNRGIFLLISKADRVISNTLIPRHLAASLPETTRIEIRDAFARGVSDHMRSEKHTSVELSDQDAGLKSLVSAIERTTEQVIRGTAAARHITPTPANGPRQLDAGRPGVARGGGSSLMTFLMIGLGILAVLFFVRLLGGLFGGAHPSGMGGQGMRGPGYGGPGYGGPGYGGGGGGGFFSGMLGGLGGALAGNWLYDQMSGRHGSGHYDASSYTPENQGGYYSQGDEPIVGGDDGGSGGASWGDSGGDWGGGDGGADWGGGGGDWGGGDGGGDW